MFPIGLIVDDLEQKNLSLHHLFIVGSHCAVVVCAGDLILCEREGCPSGETEVCRLSVSHNWDCLCLNDSLSYTVSRLEAGVNVILEV